VVSIEPSLGAIAQVRCVQEERDGAVHDSTHCRRSDDDGVASERADVRDLSISLSLAQARVGYHSDEDHQ